MRASGVAILQRLRCAAIAFGVASAVALDDTASAWGHERHATAPINRVLLRVEPSSSARPKAHSCDGCLWRGECRDKATFLTANAGTCARNCGKWRAEAIKVGSTVAHTSGGLKGIIYKIDRDGDAFIRLEDGDVEVVNKGAFHLLTVVKEAPARATADLVTGSALLQEDLETDADVDNSDYSLSVDDKQGGMGALEELKLKRRGETRTKQGKGPWHWNKYPTQVAEAAYDSRVKWSSKPKMVGSGWSKGFAKGFWDRLLAWAYPKKPWPKAIKGDYDMGSGEPYPVPEAEDYAEDACAEARANVGRGHLPETKINTPPIGEENIPDLGDIKADMMSELPSEGEIPNLGPPDDGGGDY